MRPLTLDEDAADQEVIDHYGIPVTAEEFERIASEAETIMDVQQATRSRRTMVRPALAYLGLLEEVGNPARELIAEKRGRRY
jgi:hypothetical protein